LKSADGAVKDAAKVLPEAVIKPIEDACTKVTTELTGVVGSVCTDATTKVEEAAKSVCAPLTAKAMFYAHKRGDFKTLKLMQQHEVERRYKALKAN